MAFLGEQTVPDALMGCWRREWIRFRGDNQIAADGSPDRSVTVIWLQTASGMGDLRLDPQQRPEETNSSCGITLVETTPGEDGSPMVTADWLDGPTGFAQQRVSNFPEKGWLTWDSPTVMREAAPSGAYIEEWVKLAGSSGEIVHLNAPDAPTLTNLYIAGSHYFLAVQATPDEQLHQFSYGVRAPDAAGVDALAAAHIQIELSTIDTLVGTALRLDYDWTTVSHRSS